MSNPGKYQQRQDRPDEEDQPLDLEIRLDRDEQIAITRPIWEEYYAKSSFVKDILFYLLFFFVTSVVLYSWLIDPTILIPVISILLDHLIIIVITLFISVFRYPIYRSTSSTVSFRPIDFQWKVTYAVEILASKDNLPRFTTLLKNMPHLTLFQVNDIGEERTKLVITATRRLLPIGIGPSKLKSILHSLLRSSRVVFAPTAIPDIRFQRFHMIKTSKLYLQLEELVRQLQVNEVSGQLVTVFRVNRSTFIKEHAKIETLYDFYVGFAAPDLDQWIGLMNTISREVVHRPYLFYLLNRYSPLIWGYLHHLLRLPGISWLVELRARNTLYLRKVEQAFVFPRFDYHSDTFFNFSSPNIKVSYSYRLGKLVNQGVETKNMGIPYRDLAQGGIIAGAIGTGKTTLRLHLMQLVKNAGIRVIDFDLKGDATRYASLVDGGKVVIPNRNYHLNPFNCPNGFNEREYANILLQSFVETIPAGEELSPPQLHLLTRAIYKTVEEKGNARSFFKNLYVLGHQEQQFIDNNQENTAQAVITRFNWMQTVMHDIFWQSRSSLLITDYERTSLFFDLSELEMTATRPQIRFLINLIMARITASMRHRKESKLSDVIFLDETQILMPRRRDHAELTKLEQTVTTLRYKGVAVIAAGVSAALMSPVLLDTGFVAQFRSENTMLERALGLTDSETEEGLIAQLPRFHALVRSNSIGSKAVMAKIRKFDSKIKIPEVELPQATPLASFELDFDNIWAARLDGIILSYIDLTTYLQQELRQIAMKFVRREYELFHFKEDDMLADLDRAEYRLQKLISSHAVEPVVARYFREFLLFVIYYYYTGLVEQLKYDSKLNLVRKNLESLVHTMVQHVMQLTEDKPRQVFDAELVQLRRYISQIEEFQQLDREDLNGLTVEIAAQLEKLTRQLGLQSRGLAMSIAEMTAAGWLTPQQHALLEDFNKKIRNPIVHGSYLYKSTDTTLVYRAARLTISLVEEYRDLDRNFHTDFTISPSEEDETSSRSGSSGDGAPANSSDRPSSTSRSSSQASMPSKFMGSGSVSSQKSQSSSQSPGISATSVSEPPSHQFSGKSSNQLSNDFLGRSLDRPSVSSQDPEKPAKGSPSSYRPPGTGFPIRTSITEYSSGADPESSSKTTPRSPPGPSRSKSLSSTGAGSSVSLSNLPKPGNGSLSRQYRLVKTPPPAPPGSASSKKADSSADMTPDPVSDTASDSVSDIEPDPASETPTNSSQTLSSPPAPSRSVSPPAKSPPRPPTRKKSAKPSSSLQLSLDSAITTAFDALWLQRFDSVIHPHIACSEAEYEELTQLAQAHVSHAYSTYQFDPLTIKKILTALYYQIQSRKVAQLSKPVIVNHPTTFLLLVLQHYLHQVVNTARGSNLLNQIEQGYQSLMEKLIYFLAELTG